MTIAISRSVLALGAAAVIVIAGPSAPAIAYDLRPIVIQLNASGPGAAQTATITNSHNVPIAIEVKVFARAQNPDGTDTLTPENENVLVSPPQMVIAPKSTQSFRIQWVGDANPDRELAYRVVTEQLPIQFKKVTAGDRTADVTMRYRYEAALYVLPKDRRVQATLSSVAPVKGADGAERLELRIRSEGNARAILDKPALDLIAGGASVRLEGDAVKELVGLNILPGNERVVQIAMPASLHGKQIAGKLDTQYVNLN